MSRSDEQIAFALELFEDLSPLTTRKMMGGLCLYHDGTIFALMKSDGSLLLKGAGEMKDWMEAEGWTHWTYIRDNGRKGTMPYWKLPEAVLDDPEEACALARRALASL